MKGFLLRPFDERSMSETLAFSALVHAMLFFSGTLLAWLLPRYIEPFPSTRVEIISEAELQQRLKTYRTEAKTTPRETLPQEQPATEQPTTEQQKAEQPTAKQPTEQSAAVKKPPKERVGEATTQEKPKDTIDGLLTALEETSNEEASLEESLGIVGRSTGRIGDRDIFSDLRVRRVRSNATRACHLPPSYHAMLESACRRACVGESCCGSAANYRRQCLCRGCAGDGSSAHDERSFFP